MKSGKNIAIKVSCLILVFTFVICSLSSCGSKEEAEEITRGTDAIEKPQVTQANATSVSGQATTAPEATTSKTSALLGDISDLPSNFDMSNANSSSSSGGSNVDPAFLAGAVRAMGFEYDPAQNIFYTGLNNWQRNANYVGHYDTFAKYGNMRYQTIKIDIFGIDGLDWRFQMWKGQYGIFGGCEVGVYTKDPATNEMLYNCADDDHLIYMSSELYKTKEDYENHNLYFKRDWQLHWWLTGFKLGTVDPPSMVMRVRIRMRNSQMADAFEQALRVKGFLPGNATSQYDTYERSINDFYILWADLGEMNYIAQTYSTK